MTQNYPKRLIEVDLPIKRISAHARREKSIRHGHISTLHIWWARRPLAACRAVICASLWPDPADPLCPQSFREKAAKIVSEFAAAAVRNKDLGESCDRETWLKWQALTKGGGIDVRNEAHWNVLRFALLDFIADFANWDNSTVADYLQTSRALTEAAHEALGGETGSRPLVVDPFAGGGSIPLEALRVGANAFASDLNPIPVLLNKVVLEYIPKYGERLANEVRKSGEWIKQEAEKKLAEFFPKDPDGATPIAYLWARTIRCEGPGCGAELPLVRSLWLCKKDKRTVGLKLNVSNNRATVDLEIVSSPREIGHGTVKSGSATCPCCGYTTPLPRVREQLKMRRGGANDCRLLCVVTEHPSNPDRQYRPATDKDVDVFQKSLAELASQERKQGAAITLVPNETISLNEIRRISVPIYGMSTWGDLFTARQNLVIATLLRLVRQVNAKFTGENAGLGIAVQTCLAMTVNKLADYNSSLCTWHFHSREKVNHTFARQAIPFVCDFVEVAPFGGGSGNWSGLLEWTLRALESQPKLGGQGQIERASATTHPLPSGSADALITDPPYYDAIPYSHLSDFFYVLFRRSLADTFGELFTDELSPKSAEIVVDRPHKLSTSAHNVSFYERELGRAFVEGRRVIRPDGIATLIFASKTTASWEALLRAVIDAGWVITGSWPVDTEMETRVAAQGQARLASSVHLVCRPRQHEGGSVPVDEVGDWRDVLQQLPKRIHEWMPRLADEGVVGADAIFACLGPALEIFSRFSRVEKANGDTVALREYLEHVWAAVAKEALAQVFKGADATGFEPDARLTAIWLWTLAAPSANGTVDDAEGESDEEYGAGTKVKPGGYRLEYDAARKIAQGLGAHLEDLNHLVEVKGEEARLLPLAERTRHLFGKDEEEPSRAPSHKKSSDQLNMFAELTGAEDAERVWQEKTVKKIGQTTLDRVHQAMILFAAGRGEALKRFMVEDGVGADGKFWRLAQALAALYPAGSEEKRWVEGVMARKKQFGF